MRAVCKVGVGEQSLVHAGFQSEVEHGLLVAVIDTRNASEVALLVISLDTVDDVGGKVLHCCLGVAHHEFLSVHFYLLNFLAVDGYLAVVAHLCARQTLHKFFDGGAFGCAERRGIIYKGVFLERNLGCIGCYGGSLQGYSRRCEHYVADRNIVVVADRHVAVEGLVAYIGELQYVLSVFRSGDAECSIGIGHAAFDIRTVLAQQLYGCLLHTLVSVFVGQRARNLAVLSCCSQCCQHEKEQEDNLFHSVLVFL